MVGAAVLILPSDIEVPLSCSRGGFVEGRVSVACGVWRVASYCEWLYPSLPFVCPLSQHCWFSVVSLWQGCVIVE